VITDDIDLGICDLIRGEDESSRRAEHHTIMEIIKENADPAKRAYRFYMSHGIYNMERSRFLLLQTQLAQFMHDCKCSGTVKSEIGDIQSIVTCKRDKDGNIVKDDSGRRQVAEHIDLRGFIEALVRMAEAQYRNTLKQDHSHLNLPEMYQAFMKRHFIHANFFHNDGFRARTYLAPEVQKVVNERGKELRAVHDFIIGLGSSQKEQMIRSASAASNTTAPWETDARGIIKSEEKNAPNHVTLGDISRIVKACGMYGAPNGLSNGNIVYIYFASNYEEESASTWMDWDYTMMRPEFYECIARLAYAAAKMTKDRKLSRGDRSRSGMTREISNSSKIGKEASMALFKLFQDAEPGEVATELGKLVSELTVLRKKAIL